MFQQREQGWLWASKVDGVKGPGIQYLQPLTLAPISRHYYDRQLRIAFPDGPQCVVPKGL